MKTHRNQTQIALLLLLLPALLSISRGAPVSTAVLAVTGEVKSGDANVSKGDSFKFGQHAQSGHGSGAMLAPVPGQLVFVDEDTQVVTLTTEMSTDNGPVRSSTLFLGSGHVHSTVEEAKQGSNTQELRTPCGKLTSNDGSWSSWSTEGAAGVTQHAAVYHGTVTLHRSSDIVALKDAAGSAPAGGETVQLTAGQVASWTCEDPDGAVKVIDLRTGRLITYINGVEISSVVATPQQLMEARMLFEEGLAPFLATASDASRIAFGQLLGEINKTLAANMLPIIRETSEWQLFPDWSRSGIRSPSDLASPEQPGTSQ